MPNFQKFFLNFDLNFGTHGSSTILSFLIVSILSFHFTEVALFIYPLVTFSKTVILCPFPAKTFIKFFSEQMRDKSPLNTPLSILGQMLECGYI